MPRYENPSAGRGAATMRNAWPLIALFGGAAAIGFAPIFVRWSDTGPVASAFWRLALAAPLLWLWVGLRTRRPDPSARALWRVALLPGLFFAADLGVWHWSIVYTTVANATLLCNLAPILVTLGAWILFRERVARVFFIGMATALGGALLLAGPSLSFGGTRPLGDALALLTAVFYASYLLAIKHARATTSAVTLMALSTSISAAALLPVAWLSPQPLLPGAAQGWWVLIALALVTQVLGQGLIVYALAHLRAAFSSVSLLIQPIVAAALAWVFFGEVLSGWQLFGSALVLVGIFVARRTG